MTTHFSANSRALYETAVAELGDPPSFPPLPGSEGALLADAIFLGEYPCVICPAPKSRGNDVRWGELLYDLASSAMEPWTADLVQSNIRLRGALRLSPREMLLIAEMDGFYVFNIPYAYWPEGLHNSLWESVAERVLVTPSQRVNTFTENGWV